MPRVEVRPQDNRACQRAVPGNVSFHPDKRSLESRAGSQLLPKLLSYTLGRNSSVQLVGQKVMKLPI